MMEAGAFRIVLFEMGQNQMRYVSDKVFVCCMSDTARDAEYMH